MIRVAVFVVVCLSMVRGIAAQSAGDCQVVFDRVGKFNQTEGPALGILRRGWEGVEAHCEGRDTRMWSDSAEYRSLRQRVDFFRAVKFQDSTVILDADRATYFLADDRLEAYGNVRLRNRKTGSTLEGPNLIYWRSAPGIRDSTTLHATGRPTVNYRATSDTTEPYVIVANQVKMVDNDAAWAWGRVTIDRSDFNAVGDSAELFLSLGNGLMDGNARVVGGDTTAFVIAGRSIAFRLVEDALRWVQSRENAEAESEAWRIVADTLEFEIADDLIQGGLAWGDSTRPQAVSLTQTITADSLAIDTPGQVLTEIRGFGAGRATSVRDSLDTGVDWIRGDSIVASFGDNLLGQRGLTNLLSRGHALSHYRIYPAGRTTCPAINYSRGQRIQATFGPLGEIARVDVVGGADGLHLEPDGTTPECRQ